MILIVDDRPENILPLKKILELHNFETDTADSGELALKKILKNTYSLIILDVQMPGMDGFEVAEAISGYSKAKDTPIIFLSAVNKEKKFIAKGYTAGAIDYITKPVDPDILILKVKTFDKIYRQQNELKSIQSSLHKEIDRHKLTQEELVSRMQELHTVLESLPQIAFTLNDEGRIEYVNEKWFQYSASPEEYPEIHPEDRIPPEEWKNHFSSGAEFNSELRIRNLATGQFRYHLMKIIPAAKDTEVRRWIGTMTDIQQQKLANEVLEEQVQLRTKELKLKNEELEVANQELQQFTWVVSHDLKEPLRKIQVFNNIIKEKYIGHNNEAEAFLEKTIRSSERMSQLIDDLMSYSRLPMESLFREADLEQLVNEVVMDFDSLIAEKNAVVTVENLPVVECIPSLLRQMFQNLVSNALKFSQQDVPPRIRISAERVEKKEIGAKPAAGGAFCRITVQDNGIGFNEKYLDRIFVIFQRLNTRASYEGTGIGLAITKKIVDRHNGIITARSNEENGACFIIILPIKHS
jgi:signal transduction histidine kinase/DNA-binding response OmpR family regulator